MGKTYQSRAFIFDHNPTVLTAGAYSVVESDELLKCDVSSGTIDIDLLPIEEKWDYEYKLYVIDSVNASDINNITIYAPPGHYINGQPSIVLNTNGTSALIRIVDSTNYIAHISVEQPAYPGIINTTYSAFDNFVSTNSLIPGAWYRISDYQTVHYILEDPSLPVNVGPTEPIYVFAITDTYYDNRVISEDYRQDLIYWRHDYKEILIDAAFSDSGLPVDGFKGRITYRKDTINNIETYYDWRVFLFRRWAIDTTGIPTWDSVTGYPSGTLVFDSVDNCYYLAIHNVVASTYQPYQQGGFIKVLDTSNSYIFPQPYAHSFNLGKTSTFVTIPVDSTDYQDFLTVSPKFSVTKNISIEERGGFPSTEGNSFDTYYFTSLPIANTSIPNIILVTDLGVSIGTSSTINGFYSKGNSSVSTFYFKYTGDIDCINKNIEINSSIGILFSLAYTGLLPVPIYPKANSIEFKNCNSNILACDYVESFSLDSSQFNIFNSSIIASDFKEITNTTFRSTFGNPNASAHSQFNYINSSNYFAQISNCKFNYITSCWFGYLFTQQEILACDASTCNSEDYTGSTHIYNATYDTKIMGTTGGSYLFYMDNTGTLQTDVATN